MGYLKNSETRRIEALIRQAGLPVKIPKSLDGEKIIAQLRMDKKKKDGIIHFVLLKKNWYAFHSCEHRTQTYCRSD